MLLTPLRGPWVGVMAGGERVGAGSGAVQTGEEGGPWCGVWRGCGLGTIIIRPAQGDHGVSIWAVEIPQCEDHKIERRRLLSCCGIDKEWL